MTELKFRFEGPTQADKKAGTFQRPTPNLMRRFKLNLRLISQSHKNKLSNRLQEVDRLYVCKKSTEQRKDMGKEFADIKLADVYVKSKPNRILQKYGQEFVISSDLVENKRQVLKNEDYKEKPADEEEDEEEALIDEQKLFQNLHESLEKLKISYNKSTEYISELFVRVCGDLQLVEQALQGKDVPQWTYLEDLALTKPMDTAEYQWLLNTKGQKQILKRRKFLLTADATDDVQGGAAPGEDEALLKAKREQEEEDLMHDPNIDETVPFLM